jgi:SAM-dependent methyltransferase
VTNNTAVRDYWNQHIHDLDVSAHAPGTREFFADLEQYHFEKLHHLPRLIDFDAYRGKRVLDVGCGAGTDLMRFARGGAIVTGVDISSSAIALARQNFAQQGLSADLREADGEHLPFGDNEFDFVFAHGVVQYTTGDRQLVAECRRVLKPGGTAMFQVYNRISWLNALSTVMLTGFRDVRLVEERFPVKSRLHGGWKGTLFNTFFVGTFNALPRAWVRRFGWHLLAFCVK